MPKRNSKEKSKTKRQISNKEDIKKNRYLAVVCYFWIFAFVPFVLRKNDPYVIFHAKQGIVLALAWFLVWVVGIIPILGWLVFFFGGLTLLVVNLMAIAKAWHGEEWKIPYLYDYVKVLNL